MIDFTEVGNNQERWWVAKHDQRSYSITPPRWLEFRTLPSMMGRLEYLDLEWTRAGYRHRWSATLATHDNASGDHFHVMISHWGNSKQVGRSP